MRVGLIIYGSLDTLSGGYLFDRRLVEYLREQGDTLEIISLPWRNYAAHLTDNLSFRLPRGLDLVIQDELNHPSLIAANRSPHPYPVISLVHHLRSSERRPAWQNSLYRRVEKRYLHSVDGFIFNSKTTEKAVSALVEADKPSVVAYPPTDRFGVRISEAEIVARAQSNELRILFLGNVIYRKGLHTLIDAVEKTRTTRRDTKTPARLSLDIVGSLTFEPGYAKALQERVSDQGLSALVTFHSSLDHEPLINILKSAHVLVVPSSYEGYGIVYLEGMAFGLPAIGTTAGAAGEIITDEVDGFLVGPGDADSLAARLEVLAGKRDVLVRMSLAARARYLRQPKWTQTAASIRDFLARVIAQ